MRRICRYILSAVMLLSLSLSVATCVLWVRSYWRMDCIRRYSTPPGADAGASSRGSLIVFHMRMNRAFWQGWEAGRANRTWEYQTEPGPIRNLLSSDATVDVRFAGFRFQRDNARFADYRALVVPLWAPGLVGMILPAVWLRRRCRARVVPGRCRRCGYDLRATPDRCPECGTPTREVAR